MQNVCIKRLNVSKIHCIDFEFDHDYTLIGIHSVLADYRMAFFLNDSLGIKLRRFRDDLDFKSKNCSFPLFTFEDESTFTSWSLISNKYIFTEETASDRHQLFEQETKISYLIPEKKRVDYFIKINGFKDDRQIDDAIIKINRINNIITSYPIDPIELKSKDNLIF